MFALYENIKVVIEKKKQKKLFCMWTKCVARRNRQDIKPKKDTQHELNERFVWLTVDLKKKSGQSVEHWNALLLNSIW